MSPEPTYDCEDLNEAEAEEARQIALRCPHEAATESVVTNGAERFEWLLRGGRLYCRVCRTPLCGKPVEPIAGYIRVVCLLAAGHDGRCANRRAGRG